MKQQSHNRSSNAYSIISLFQILEIIRPKRKKPIPSSCVVTDLENAPDNDEAQAEGVEDEEWGFALFRLGECEEEEEDNGASADLCIEDADDAD